MEYGRGKVLNYSSLYLIIFQGVLQREAFKTLRGHTNFVFCVNFNPDTNLLVSGGYDETIRVWDVARGASLCSMSFPSYLILFKADSSRFSLLILTQ